MLDKRLLVCADLIRKGAKVCDVGTDHAYLPCYLVLEHITQDVTAADVNRKPLESAKRTIREAGLSGKVKTMLSDGLQKIDSDTQDIVIAGMGGELIAKILFSCPWCRDSQKRLILQPMTNIPYLRAALYREGFEILLERPVSERGHFYTVLLCRWCGEKKEISKLFSLIGKIPECGTLEGEEHLRYQVGRLEKIAAGLNTAKAPEKRREAKKIDALVLEIRNKLKTPEIETGEQE
jgi:tRNA (adenine22-N1)-methyltransferase